MSVALQEPVDDVKSLHQSLSIHPYKPLIGAVIENVDLSRPLSERNRQDLNRALVRDLHPQAGPQLGSTCRACPRVWHADPQEHLPAVG